MSDQYSEEEDRLVSWFKDNFKNLTNKDLEIFNKIKVYFEDLYLEKFGLEEIANFIEESNENKFIILVK